MNVLNIQISMTCPADFKESSSSILSDIPAPWGGRLINFIRGVASSISLHRTFSKDGYFKTYSTYVIDFDEGGSACQLLFTIDCKPADDWSLKVISLGQIKVNSFVDEYIVCDEALRLLQLEVVE